MPVDKELLEILVCPETRQPVRLATSEELESLNRRVRAGELRTRGGDPVKAPIQEGLMRQDGKVLYPVDDGIPVMLVEQSLQL